jgi:hypothetical protein
VSVPFRTLGGRINWTDQFPGRPFIGQKCPNGTKSAVGANLFQMELVAIADRDVSEFGEAGGVFCSNWNWRPKPSAEAENSGRWRTVPQTGALTGLRYAPPGQVACGVWACVVIAGLAGWPVSGSKSHRRGPGARVGGQWGGGLGEEERAPCGEPSAVSCVSVGAESNWPALSRALALPPWLF